jgi:hypothetical protein
MKTRTHRTKWTRRATQSEDRREGRLDRQREEVSKARQARGANKGSRRARGVEVEAPFTTSATRGARQRPGARSSQHGPTHSTRESGPGQQGDPE